MSPSEFLGRFPRPPRIPDQATAVYGEYLGGDIFEKVGALQVGLKETPSFSEVVPRVGGRGGLYLGNAIAAAEPGLLAANAIGLIVQATGDERPKALVRAAIARMGGGAPLLLELDMNDLSDNLSVTRTKSLDYPPHGPLQLLDLMRTARNDGVNVLVNCTVGISRSSSIVLMHLMDPRGENMPLLDALRFLKMKRPVIFPSIRLLQELMAYERELRGESTISDALFQLNPMRQFSGGKKRRVRKTRRTKKTRKSRRRA